MLVALVKLIKTRGVLSLSLIYRIQFYRLAQNDHCSYKNNNISVSGLNI